MLKFACSGRKKIAEVLIGRRKFRLHFNFSKVKHCELKLATKCSDNNHRTFLQLENVLNVSHNISTYVKIVPRFFIEFYKCNVEISNLWVRKKSNTVGNKKKLKTKSNADKNKKLNINKNGERFCLFDSIESMLPAYGLWGSHKMYGIPVYTDITLGGKYFLWRTTKNYED